MINQVRPPIESAAPAPRDSLQVAVQRNRYRGPALTDEEMSGILEELRQGARFAVRVIDGVGYEFHLTATVMDGFQTLVPIRNDSLAETRE